MRYLAIDIGSSFLKSAILFPDRNAYAQVERTPMPVLPCGEGRHELNVKTVAALVREKIDASLSEGALDGVLFSSQMHGLLLRDAAGGALMNFITWQDCRALELDENNRTMVQEAMDSLAGDDLVHTGETLCASHGVCILFSLKKDWEHARLSLLGDAVAEELCGHPVPMHETMAASTGLYDLTTGDWNRAFCARWRLELPPVCKDIAPVGDYRGVPLYPAMGDQQVAVLGSFIRSDDLLINAATGAQIVRILDEQRFGKYSLRPYFGGKYLQTVTHLPGGRCLNVLAHFVMDIGRSVFMASESDAQVWSRLNDSIGAADAQGLSIKMSVDSLSEGRGAIEGIGEENFKISHLVYAAYTGMAEAYRDAWRRMGENEIKRLICAGSVVRKSDVFRRILGERFQTPCVCTPYDEDVLVGLLRLSMVAAHICGLEESGEELMK